MKFLFFQNLIAPYRISLFNELNRMNLDFEVLYMCEKEKNRDWNIDYQRIKYPYVLDRGFYKYFCGFHLHWNIRLIKYALSQPSNIVLGASWNDLNIMALCMLKRLGFMKHHHLFFWAEANKLTIGARKKNKIRDFLRKYIYSSHIDAFIVPGEMAILSLQEWGIHLSKVIKLPNVIEEEKFNRNFERTNDLKKLPEFVCPVRLEEKIKGIINFFSAIGQENVRKAIFHILGSGNDRDLIQNFIEKNGYQNNIILHGFCNVETMVDFYEKADVFLLPSFSDPSPLSIVEACCSKLPLLISSRCGNHFETLIEGVNGYSFDPDNHLEIKITFEKLMCQRVKWIEMGKYSRQLFDNNFKQSKVLREFVNSLRNFEV